MKKIYIIGFIILGALLLNGCGLIEKIEVEEYQTYLENKYGKDKGFYMVEEYRCNWFELGTCSYLFSSKELNGETFEIIGEISHGENVFNEWYIGAKYKKSLENYYKNLLGNALNFNYTMNITANYDNIDAEITFNDYLKYDKLDLVIQIETNDENVNVELLQTKVKNIINSNQIKNIDLINLHIDRCSGENYTDECFDNYTIYQSSNY